MVIRDWQATVGAVKAGVSGEMGRRERMQQVVDAVWDALGGDRGGVSWVGFYLPTAKGNEMELGPRRDVPACSPIGMHGVCGKAFTRGEVMIVDDVRDLGSSYIACDPRDRSELVVPLLEMQGRPWAVLDLDSHDVGAFSVADEIGLHEVLLAAGLVDDGRDK